jgi:hypothetical protein
LLALTRLKGKRFDFATFDSQTETEAIDKIQLATVGEHWLNMAKGPARTGHWQKDRARILNTSKQRKQREDEFH